MDRGKCGTALHLAGDARAMPLGVVVTRANANDGCQTEDVLHALLYVLVTGIGWRMLPPCFPSYKTVQRRLRIWLALDAFRTAWSQLAHRYEALQGINWDEVLLDGSKKPAKKGARKLAPAPWIAANAGRRCT